MTYFIQQRAERRLPGKGGVSFTRKKGKIILEHPPVLEGVEPQEEPAKAKKQKVSWVYRNEGVELTVQAFNKIDARGKIKRALKLKRLPVGAVIEKGQS